MRERRKVTGGGRGPDRSGAAGLRVAAAAWQLVCLLFALLPTPAASADRAIELQAFTPDHGLGSLASNVLLHDRDGVWWVGTDNGLFRFDGSSFIAVASDIDPLELHVSDLYQSPSDRVWVGASRHLYAWDGGRLHRVADLPVDDLRRIAGDGGDGVFVRHQRQLWHVSAKGEVSVVAWPRALSPGALTDGPLLWSGGHLWTTCGDALCERVGADTRVWGVAEGVPRDTWITLHASADGDLWVGGNHHLLHLRAGANRFDAIPASDPLEAIDVDSEGRVLAASVGELHRWDGHAWTAFGDAQTLHQAQIRDVGFEPAGAVWLATGGRGVLRWRGYGQFENWSVAQGLDSAPTWALARDANGRLWMGNQRFGNLLEPGATQLSPWPAALQQPAWTDAVALVPRGRRMWILFNEGRLVRYDLDTRGALPVADHLGWSKFALADLQGRLWIGTHGTLWRVDDTDAATPSVRAMATGLPADTNYLGATVDAQGRLWFATTHGLLRYGRDGFSTVRLDEPLRAGGLVDAAIGGDGTLWLAPVAGGLLRTHPGDGDTLAVHDAGDTLLDATALHSLEVDPSGRLWAFHGAGVDLLMDGRWRRLDRSDGLVWNDMATGAFLADADGSVWLGTSGGVSHVLHPARLGQVALSAPVLLEARYGSAPIQPGLSPVLDWTGQALSVLLAQPGLTHPSTQQLQYRLRDGNAMAELETADGNRARYAALAPGDYRFEARLFDPGLRQHSPWTGFHVVVVPPWWRSNAARVGYVLLAVLLLWGLWRWRNAQLLRRQAALEALVRERTLALEHDKHALELARQALQYEASHDALTGLLNRGAVVETLVQAVSGAGPVRRRVGVALIDLDHFKRINDTYGHLTGDAVLVQCAQRLGHLVPAEAALGRFGGEEFVVVWPGLAGDADLAALFAPLMDAPYRDGDRWLEVTCSVGVTWARHGEDATEVLRRADAALYRAKQAGRARVVRSD